MNWPLLRFGLKQRTRLIRNQRHIIEPIDLTTELPYHSQIGLAQQICEPIKFTIGSNKSWAITLWSTDCMPSHLALIYIVNLLLKTLS